MRTGIASCTVKSGLRTVRRSIVNLIRIIAIVLIIAGIAGLVYGKFSYTESSHKASVGPIDFSVSEKKTVNVPLWAGVVAIVAGAALLFVPKS